jgi:hypothetical protein
MGGMITIFFILALLGLISAVASIPGKLRKMRMDRGELRVIRYKFPTEYNV